MYGRKRVLRNRSVERFLNFIVETAGIAHLALNGGIGYNHRCFAYRQLDDMLVAVNAGEAVAFLQIQMQIKVIDLGAAPAGMVTVCEVASGSMVSFIRYCGLRLRYRNTRICLSFRRGFLLFHCIFRIQR